MGSGKRKNTRWLEDLEGLFFLETGSRLCTNKIDINLDSYDADYEVSVRNPKFAAIYNLHEMLIAHDQNANTALIAIYEIEQDLLSAELYRKILFIGYDSKIHKKLLDAIKLLESNIEQLWLTYNNDQIMNFKARYRYDSIASFLNDVYEIFLSLKSIEKQLSDLDDSLHVNILEKIA